MRTQGPLIVTFIAGTLILISFFVPHDPIGEFETLFLRYYMIIAGFTLVIGLITLGKVHVQKIIKKREGFGYSVILIISMLVTLGISFYSGEVYKGLSVSGSPFMWYYNNIFIPLSATTFSLLAFFISSAAYRAFRARTLEATLLLIAGVIVMLGRVPLGAMLWDKLPVISDWIMDVPQMAAKRGILVGIALGMIITGLRIILGIERTYLK
jgi:hypothetical protein